MDNIVNNLKENFHSPKEEVQYTYTNRGFSKARFSDSRKSPITIQESSLIDPHIWIICDNDFITESSALLNIKQVKIIVDILSRWVEKYEKEGDSYD